MTKICSTCQAENRDDADSCRVCGALFDDDATVANGAPRLGMACPECGYLNQRGVRFCAKCGGNLAAGAAASGATAPMLRSPGSETGSARAPIEPPIDSAASLPLPASLSPASMASAPPAAPAAGATMSVRLSETAGAPVPAQAGAAGARSDTPRPASTAADRASAAESGLAPSSVTDGARTDAPHAADPTADPSQFDGLPPLDLPDPDAALEAGRTHANGWADSSVGFAEPAGPPPVDRRSLWAGLGIAAAVAVAMAWWFLDTAPPPSEAAPAPAVAAAPASATPASAALAASAPPAVEKASLPASEPQRESASASTPADTTATSAMPVAASSVASSIASTVASSASAVEATSTTPSSAAPSTQSPSAQATTTALHPAAARPRAPSISEAENQRLAALRRARDKAEREARVKAAIEQREQAVARLRNEQDNARRRADEQARAATLPRANPSSMSAGAAMTPIRSVKEICAGRNPISQAVCESRECGNAEHASESGCRAIRANEERRRDRVDR